jgi:hypothetical protein
MSLYPSLPTLLLRNVFPAAVLSFAFFRYGSDSYVWPVCAVILGLSVLFTTWRVDLNAEGIDFVQLFPLWRKQRFKWSDLGPFHQYEGWGSWEAPEATLQARILSGKGFWVMGVYRSRKVWLKAEYAPSPRGTALGVEALESLLESYGAAPQAKLPPLP